MADSITHHRIRRGLDIPLAGTPERRLEEAQQVSTVALIGPDHRGLRARLAVNEGDRVVRGDPLFSDRKTPGVLFTSPAAGRIAAIERGRRRRLLSVQIVVDAAAGGGEEERDYPAHSATSARDMAPAQVRDLMVQSGLWPALRARPFSATPSPADRPRSLFVTAIDTQPLACPPELALAGREEDWAEGLVALATFMDGGPVRLCVAPDSWLGARAPAGIQVHSFAGPHPAGDPGVHIHRIDPVDLDRTAWHLAYPDVAALGGLVRRGRLPRSRIVSLGGAAARRPRLLRTREGARLSQLLAGELQDGDRRVISGSALNGRAVTDPALDFLGRYHRQITVLSEDRRRRLLGWMVPGGRLYSVSRLFLSAFSRHRPTLHETTDHGAERPFIGAGAYDAVLPFDTLAVPLLRSLLAGDDELAAELGCLELDEEDLALASFVCASKIDHGAALRGVLDRIEREGV